MNIRALLFLLFLPVLLAACGGGGGGGSSAPPPVASVTVTPSVANVVVGYQLQLNATTKDALGNVLVGRVTTWASSNTAVATVSATGLVNAVTSGQATITATSEGQSATAPLAAYTGLAFTSVSAGSKHTCGVTSNGAAYCWGDDSSGQLGDGTMTSSALPVPVAGGLGFVSVSAGGSHSCGVTVSGAAYCWGDNSAGQLGNGTTANSATPVLVSGGLSFTSVSAGGSHSCGVTVGGSTGADAYCWGNNSSGQLGNGTTVSAMIPVLIFSGFPWDFASAGSNHTCATGHSGGSGLIPFLSCWGDNSSGQLGDGTMTSSATPVVFHAAISGVISAGTLYSCLSGGVGSAALTTICWGSNSSGQLGNASTTNSPVPVTVSGGLILHTVSAGAAHTCAATSIDGHTFSGAYCWGGNNSGELGNGATTNSSVPVAVAGGLNYTTISAGGHHTCGVAGTIPKVAGAIYCWGDNSSGQLGNPSATSSSVPVNVAGSS